MKYYTPTRLSENIHETPEGYLVCIGVPIARTGEMEYGEGETPIDSDSKGKVIISRDEAEVFRPQTIASFEGKAITITHPKDFVSPENWSQLAKGILQNVRRGEGEEKNDLLADLLITDKMAIALVKNGLREVSCGYEADYTQTDEGRGNQKNIVGNHLALVESGRAGSAYAINDHKCKNEGVKKMSIKDKMKAIFAKAQDEVTKIADEDDQAIGIVEKKEGEKKGKEEIGDKKSMDELVKMVKDLGAKIESMSKPKDSDDEDDAEDSDDESESKEKKEEAYKDSETSLEDRLKSLETAVAKLLEMESAEQESGDEDDSDDEDDESDMCGDEDKEDKKMVGDSASRAEILAPGINKKTKDLKTKALKASYATKAGKTVIDSLLGGKKLTFDSAEKVNTLFIAASELLKVSRSKDLSKTKTNDFDSSESVTTNFSAEKMNEINAKFYNRK